MMKKHSSLRTKQIPLIASAVLFIIVLIFSLNFYFSQTELSGIKNNYSSLEQMSAAEEKHIQEQRRVFARLDAISLGTPSAPNALSTKSISGGYSDRTTGLAVDSEGNTYISGYNISSQIDFGDGNIYYFQHPGDSFIAKYSSSGNLLWVRQVNAMEGSIALLTTSAVNTQSSAANQDFFAAGYAYGQVDFGNGVTLDCNSPSRSCIFIAQYDYRGVPIKVIKAVYAGTGSNYFEGIPVGLYVNNNKLYLAGAVYFNPSVGSNQIVFGKNSSNNDVLIVKASAGATGASDSDFFAAVYSIDGYTVWAKSGEGTSVDWASGIVSDSSGNVYVAGATWSTTLILSADRNIPTNENGNLFIIKYNSSGTILSLTATNNKSCLGPIFPKSLSIYSNSYLFLGGQNYSPKVSFGTGPSGLDVNLVDTVDTSRCLIAPSYEMDSVSCQKPFVVEYYAGNLTPYWVQTEKSSALGEISSVSANSTGSVIVAGVFESDTNNFFDLGNNTKLTWATPQRTGFLAEYDFSGNAQWIKYVGECDAYNLLVAADPRGHHFRNIYAAGLVGAKIIDSPEQYDAECDFGDGKTTVFQNLDLNRPYDPFFVKYEKH